MSESASEQSARDRINGRLEAEQLLSLRKIGAGPEYSRAFASALRAYADSVLGPVETNLRVMTDEQAASFELSRIQFGQHQGLPFSLVPIDYLAWVADQSNELAAYLRSERGQKRLSREASPCDS